MLQRLSLRNAALMIVCLMFAVAGLIVSLRPSHESVSFDSVIEIWSSLVRDVDRFGLTITRISSAREMEIGKEIAANVEIHYPVVTGTPQAQYVQEVGAALVRGVLRKDIQYSFVLVQTAQINAFAIPGGRIYVTSGMLYFVKSEAEFAAVLGHEISHVDLKHCVEGVQYELALRRVAGDDIAAIAGVGYELVRRGFSKQQEMEADVNGVMLAAKAGYDPRSSVGIYQRLGDIETAGQAAGTKSSTIVGEVGGALFKSLQDYFATHPPADLRIAAVKQAIERNAANWQGLRLYVGRRNFEQWRSRSQLEIPDEFVVFSQ